MSAMSHMGMIPITDHLVRSIFGLTYLEFNYLGTPAGDDTGQSQLLDNLVDRPLITKEIHQDFPL